METQTFQSHQLRSYGINNFELPIAVADKIAGLNFPTESQLDIDRFYLRIAYELASRYSDDPIAQNGAVLVKDNAVASLDNIVAWGVNRMHEDYEILINLKELLTDKDWKLKRITHAERDAMFAAARKKSLSRDLIMYCPWTICNNCADAVVGLGGLKELIGHTGPDEFYEKINMEKLAGGEKKRGWTDMTGFEILERDGIFYRMIDGEIGGVSLIFARHEYSP